MTDIDKELLQHYISLKDYSLTQENFELYHNRELDMLVTIPKPTNEELGRFYENSEYLPHTDSHKSLFDKLYQFVKKNAIAHKVNLLNSLKPKSKTVLDIGTGTGDFLLACKINGWKTTGIEPNKNARFLTQEKFQQLSSKDSSNQFYDSLKSLQESYFENPVQFDVITMWHVLEHVPDVENYIKQIKSLLNPNGTIIVAVPNFKSYDAFYYGKFWAAFDVPRHLSHFSKKSIAVLFGNENMEVIKIFPMKMDSFYVSLLSEKYKTGKMNYFKGFLIGLQSNIKALISNEYSSHIYIIKNKKIDLNRF
ncbi:MAG: class I SAM-dependent methyltransferase [Flavobacteriaceae bacterium]|nr:class I SAM-dependent methyltransferase [Flavobacteriaceae bacterium]